MEEKRRGNPKWVKGHVANPKGKPKGTPNSYHNKVQGTLSRLRRNPVEELINIADLARVNKDYELAGKIWLELQQYREAKRKPVEVHEAPQTPEEAKENVDAMLNLLEEVEDGRSDKEESNSSQLGAGTPEVAPEARPAEDVRGDSPEQGDDVRPEL